MLFKSSVSAFVATVVICGSAQAAFAQAVDCTVPANAEDAACLNLPQGDQPITNFAPFAAPLVGGALLGMGGGSGDADSTTSTTSTTSE